MVDPISALTPLSGAAATDSAVAARTFAQELIWLLEVSGSPPQSQEDRAQLEDIFAQSYAARTEGHSWLPLPADAAALLARYPEVLGGNSQTPALLVRRGQRLFWQEDDFLEEAVAQQVLARAHTELTIDSAVAKEALDKVFPATDDKAQKTAAALALLHPITLISGGPGTGKTTTVAKLLYVLYQLGQTAPKVALAAPTGKAAAHMTRSLRRGMKNFPAEVQAALAAVEGQTLHRLLRLYRRDRSREAEPEYLDADVVVVDESSMLDLRLFYELLCQVRPNSRLILLGDAHQLPAVGLGQVFAALCRTTRLNPPTHERLNLIFPEHGLPCAADADALDGCAVMLEKSHRFPEHSGIWQLAHAVHSGSLNTEDVFARYGDIECRRSTDDFFGYWYDLQKDYWDRVRAGDLAGAFACANSAAVLTATRFEAEALNRGYRNWLMQEKQLPGGDYFPGRLIMILENDYTLNLFNGDVGLIFPDPDADSADGQHPLCAFFETETGLTRFGIYRLPVHGDAFAMTVHKSQGSEYRQVVLAANEISAPQLSRPLVYTAITRAREHFSFFGQPAWLEEAARHPQTRRDGFAERLNAAKSSVNTTKAP